MKEKRGDAEVELLAGVTSGGRHWSDEAFRLRSFDFYQPQSHFELSPESGPHHGQPFTTKQFHLLASCLKISSRNFLPLVSLRQDLVSIKNSDKPSLHSFSWTRSVQLQSIAVYPIAYASPSTPPSTMSRRFIDFYQEWLANWSL